MKGRSYRFSSTDPHEDWVDGSWTVDCVCGVNFDDGEEMVNCDDCGVWVHTRCSRYVKGEELFTCDKCKRKNNVNDIDETEVAQLLVELPTKTLRMENSCTRNVPLKRPFRLWTEIPTEEKVHVQGIPGGDPELFKGLSSVFSRELWKCTGYVPKKFNFKYREFPCWDEQEKDEIENGQQEENGAGVLFSMSKENVIAAPASAALIGMKSLDDKGPYGSKLGGAKDAKNLDYDEAEMKQSRNVLKKDKKSLLRPLITNKRRKELFGASKERMKKKVQVAKKEEAVKKGFVGKTVRPTSDSKPSESRKDREREPEGFTSDVGIIKSEKSKKAAFEESTDGGLAPKTGGDESGNTAIGIECSREQKLSDVHANGAGKMEAKAGHHFRIVLKSSATSDPSVLEGKDIPHSEANKEERHGTIADAPIDNAIDSPESFQKPSPGSTAGITQEVEEKNCDVSGNISSRKNKFKKEIADTDAGEAVALDPTDSKVAVVSQTSGASEFNKMTPSNSLPDDHKPQPVDMVPERTSSGNRDRSIELKQESMLSEAQKDSLETKLGSGLLQEPAKSCRPVPHTVSGYGKPKMVLCIGKSSSSSAAEKSSRCDDTPKPSTSRNAIRGSKQQPNDGDGDASANGNDDCVSSDVIREWDGEDETSQKALKDNRKYSMKSIQRSRTSHSSVSKTRETTSSSKVASSAAQLNGGSSEASGKNEKPGQSIFPSSSTKNPLQSIMSLDPKLSDEELALRLHHQLNSSPRVPRVPRMRQPGSLPLSPTATSFKRTSSSGSKDHATFSRRKNKDASKEGLRKFRDDERCSTRSTKTRCSPDRRTQQERGSRGGSLCTKGEENETSRTSSYSSRKVLLPPNSTTSTSSGPCSSNELNEHNMPSPPSSPRINCSPVHRTLPGLINEIMSKGKRMTYEELCNAVLPHWPHLRKHNGERYAYSSHSQAVLDCLRNRHEWARLVDRGPKTNSGKKKRKLDAEEESDEKEISQRGRKRLHLHQQHHSQGEEFPKGKRKARKRRRLSLQGKGIKVLRKKRNEEEEEEVSEEDDEDASSDTSEESVFCEEEGEEGLTTTGAGEVSASSSEEAQATS
ncbi:hypothetical protein AALP_AA1G335000 [Arabis alpina]|uniref:Zinc finger PHD-type domain-containing protein n=1 Tax=Arabis alpina TaxID=50452 RepID=A0A087HSC8_ARAAL|nr:hypothetical protein AALP_AA1G335000 [Arabis alpina]